MPTHDSVRNPRLQSGRIKRILIMLGIGKQIDAVVLPETMIDAELAALTGRTPKTAAEKEFHRWLTTWKANADERKKHK